ncbi:MAG: hypothetical protein ACPGJS_04915 [Flammeovirgaceae bacterium]
MKILKLVIIVFACTALFTACQEDQSIELFTDEESTTALDAQEFEGEIEALVEVSEQSFLSVGRVAGTDSTALCTSAVITHDADAKTIVIDFGNEGCVGPGGNIRTGKLTIVYTGDFAREHTGEKTLTFDNFAINGNGVTGNVHIGAWAKNNAEHWQSTVTSSEVVFNFTDGTSFSVNNGTRTREVIQGTLGLPVALRITGGSTGTNRAGRGYTTVISTNEPITFLRACLRSGNPYPVAGRRGIQVAGRPQFNIDFGNGTCDRLAIIQIGNSEPIPIVLGRR